jgi:putative transposase
VSRQHHFYGANHLHYLTKSVYRRVRVFDSDRFRLNFIRTLDHLRAELGFKIIGYVRMPEHFHLLIGPSELANPSRVLQRLEDRAALFVLKNLRRNVGFPWCQRMLNGLKLPPTVHQHAHHRVWQRGDCDLNIWSEKKRLEKLNYMHNHPVRRRLVAQPADWPWSSWRFYHFEDASILAMDRMS